MYVTNGSRCFIKTTKYLTRNVMFSSDYVQTQGV